MDFIERGLSEKKAIRLFFTDVTESAKTLERRHLSGPTAGRVLGQGIAGIALLSADLKTDGEAVSLQVKTDGPIGGVMVDATASGKLRGYTHKKTLSEFDGNDASDLDPVMGTTGTMAVIRSNTQRVLSVGQVSAEPPRIQVVLARYFNESHQTPTAVEVYATSKDNYLRRAVGLMADRMPHGDQEAFCEILERFNSGAVERFLDSAESILDFQELFGLDDLKVVGRRELEFGCSCNYDKIADAMSTLPDDEIRQILESGRPQRVTCHFCGELYTVREETLRGILEPPAGERSDDASDDPSDDAASGADEREGGAESGRGGGST